mgnify:CR=1 FL=1
MKASRTGRPAAFLLQSTILSGNPELIQSVGALGSTFAALANMGLSSAPVQG